jgi:PAS domain S-box-containing protein
MENRRHSPIDADSYERRILALFSTDSAERTLAAGAALLADLSGAAVAVALRADPGAAVLEGWFPGPEAATGPHGESLRSLALASLQQPPPATPARGAAGTTRYWTLGAGGQTLGAMALTLPNDRRRGEAFERRMERAVRFVAEALARHERSLEPRSGVIEQERLFRRLDRQVRVLDGERQKFAAIVNQSGTYMFVTDPGGSIRWTNRAMGLRWPPEGEATWVGRRCNEVCARLASGPSPSVCASCPVARAVVNNEVVHHEFREAADGQVHTLYLSALPIKGLDGRPQEVLVMMQDLSDLETLRESEERYRVITQAASDGIVTIGEDGIIVFANAAAERIFGHPASEMIGQPLTRLMPPALAGRHHTGFTRYLETGEKRMSWDGVQVPAIHASGRELTIEVSFGEFGSGGRRLFTGVIRDITDRRRAEIELKRAQERLRMVVSNSPIVLFATDRDGLFTLSEGRGLATLGLAPGEVVGRSAFDLYPDASQIAANLRRALAGEEFSAVVEVGALAFDTCYTPLRDEAGAVVGMIGVATDVTERRRLESQLLQSQKMEAVGRLAGGIAHDFNNLLTTVLGYSTLLLQSAGTDHPPDKRIVEIKRAAERAAGLTRQLLAFSRKQVIEPRISDMNQVVAEMEEMLRRLIGEDIEFVFTHSVPPALVRADPGQLEQMLMNLVVNARDAMPRGGRLDVEIAVRVLEGALAVGAETVPSGTYVVLTVRDTGSGMDRETLARVFEPFFTNKERGKGTGLGLAMVHGIVQQNGGQVFVQSVLGNGTTFEIYLPRTEGEPDGAEEKPASAPRAAGAETLLLVEDEAPVRALVLELLASQGYTVLEAAHGEQALAVASRHAGPIHLLVTDVVMPGMSGGELASRFVRLRPGVRVLYISGYSDDAIVRCGVSQADTAFLQKPFSYESFIAKVREVLDRPAPARPEEEPESRAA